MDTLLLNGNRYTLDGDSPTFDSKISAINGNTPITLIFDGNTLNS